MEFINENGTKIVAIVNGVAKKVCAFVSAEGDDQSCLHYFPAEGGDDEYYHFGVRADRRWLNLHFFGLKIEDLGKINTFNVEVATKVVESLGEVTFVNLYKSNAAPMYNLKLGTPSGDVRIVGTNSYIKFQLRRDALTLNRMADEAEAELNEYLYDELSTIYREEALNKDIDEAVEALHYDIDRKLAIK